MFGVEISSANVSTTTLLSSDDEQVSKGCSAVCLIDHLTRLVAVFGLLGNFLIFKTAHLLPEATSKYIMQYLAVWDSLAALEGAVIKDVFYQYVINWFKDPDKQVYNTFQLSEGGKIIVSVSAELLLLQNR